MNRHAVSDKRGFILLDAMITMIIFSSISSLVYLSSLSFSRYSDNSSAAHDELNERYQNTLSSLPECICQKEDPSVLED